MDQDNGFQVIHTYTRTQAIADGVLIDISDFAEQYGFTVPVAITATLFNGYVKPNKELEEAGQSLTGRLHDVLSLLIIHIRLLGKGKAGVEFFMDFLMDASSNTMERVDILALMHGGDNAEPVITIMLPEDY